MQKFKWRERGRNQCAKVKIGDRDDDDKITIHQGVNSQSSRNLGLVDEIAPRAVFWLETKQVKEIV